MEREIVAAQPAISTQGLTKHYGAIQALVGGLFFILGVEIGRQPCGFGGSLCRVVTGSRCLPGGLASIEGKNECERRERRGSHH